MWTWSYLTLLTVLTIIAFSAGTPFPQDDFFHYQHFIETLAGGTLDLSIPGFHGMNVFAVPWYWLTKSDIAQIEVQMFSGMLLPILSYLAASRLFASRWHGIIFATIITLMPFHAYASLRGFMVATYNCLIFLTIYGAVKNARWTWFTWGFAIISKPFAVALLPLLIYATPPSKKSLPIRYRYILYGLSIPIIYVLIQLYQVGHINVGAHEGLTQANVWSGPTRWFLNTAHSLQIMFSVHNYYFPEPGRTGHGNMMHTTPVLVFLGLYALIAWKEYFKDKGLPIVLALGTIIGIGLNIAIDHMDDYYMQTGIFFLILASLPVLRKYVLWIPIVLATLHFQWFYFYLQHGEVFQITKMFFVVPIVIDALFLAWCVFNWKEVRKLIAHSV